MRRLRSLLVFVATMIFAVPAHSQTLWQNVSVGMTAAQIQRAQPTARPSTERDTLLNGAAVCELEIPSYDIVATPFKVCFYMQDGRLVHVMLTAAEPDRPLFFTLADLLRGRYGAEIGGTAEPCEISDAIETCELTWPLENGTRVNLIFARVGTEHEGILNINYQTRIRDESQRP